MSIMKYQANTDKKPASIDREPGKYSQNTTRQSSLDSSNLGGDTRSRERWRSVARRGSLAEGLADDDSGDDGGGDGMMGRW